MHNQDIPYSDHNGTMINSLQYAVRLLIIFDIDVADNQMIGWNKFAV